MSESTAGAPSAAPRLTKRETARRALADKAVEALRGAPCERARDALLRIAAFADQAETRAVAAPTRAQVRSRLQDIVKGARTLADALDAPSLSKLGGGDGFPGAARQADAVGPVATPEALRALALGAEGLLRRIPGGHGSDRVADALGNPRGRLVCAVAALALVEQVTGKAVGATNERALDLAKVLWELAGGTSTARADDADEVGADRVAWIRHLRDAKGADPAAVSAREIVGDIIAWFDDRNALRP